MAAGLFGLVDPPRARGDPRPGAPGHPPRGPRRALRLRAEQRHLRLPRRIAARPRLRRSRRRRGAARPRRAASWTALALAEPFGDWLVGLVGVGVMVFGVHRIYTGLRATFPRAAELRGLEPDRGALGDVERPPRDRPARGGLRPHRRLPHRPGDPHGREPRRGPRRRARRIARSRFGPWALAAVAVGFLAFARPTASSRRVTAASLRAPSAPAPA